MLIRLNLISEEVNFERINILKNRIYVVYGVVWFITLLLVWISYSGKRSLMQAHIKEIVELERKIDEVVPQFFHSIKLFQTYKKQKAKLTTVYKRSVEAGFVLESLESISAQMPQNFWLEELSLVSLDNKEFDDNIKGKHKEIKVLEIKGKLFFETGNPKTNQVEAFAKKVYQSRPFDQAICKVDLANIKVGRNKKYYFHNFSVRYGWNEPYLF